MKLQQVRLQLVHDGILYSDRILQLGDLWLSSLVVLSQLYQLYHRSKNVAVETYDLLINLFVACWLIFNSLITHGSMKKKQSTWKCLRNMYNMYILAVLMLPQLEEKNSYNESPIRKRVGEWIMKRDFLQIWWDNRGNPPIWRAKKDSFHLVLFWGEWGICNEPFLFNTSTVSKSNYNKRIFNSTLQQTSQIYQIIRKIIADHQ